MTFNSKWTAELKKKKINLYIFLEKPNSEYIRYLQYFEKVFSLVKIVLLVIKAPAYFSMTSERCKYVRKHLSSYLNSFLLTWEI